MTLAQLKTGQKAFIREINTSSLIRERLNEFGLIRGVEIKVIRKGLFDNPIEINFRNFNLAIRQEVASKIIVEKDYV